MASREARRPIVWSNSGTSVIVASEVVRQDVAVVDMVTERHGDGDWLTSVLAEPLAGEGERAEVGNTAAEHVGDRGNEDGGTVQIQQREGASSADVVARTGMHTMPMETNFSAG